MVSTAVARARAHARQAKAHWKRERIARMLAQIAGGRERNAAIAEARALGARLQEIGSAIGVTRERIRQICDEHAHKAATVRIAAVATVQNSLAGDKEGQAIHVRERPVRQSVRPPQAK